MWKTLKNSRCFSSSPTIAKLSTTARLRHDLPSLHCPSSSPSSHGNRNQYNLDRIRFPATRSRNPVSINDDDNASVIPFSSASIWKAVIDRSRAGWRKSGGSFFFGSAGRNLRARETCFLSDTRLQNKINDTFARRR